MGQEGTPSLLIKTARKLFSERGYDGVSVKDIADEAGVNVSLVSYHFDGKLGLYRSCVRELGEQRLARVEMLFAIPKTAEEFHLRLQMFVEEFVHRTFEDRDFVRIILQELQQNAPRVEDIFEGTFLKACKKFIEFLTLGQKAGFARTDTDPIHVATMIFGTVFHSIQMDSVHQKFFKIGLGTPELRKKSALQIMGVLTHGFLQCPSITAALTTVSTQGKSHEK